MKQATARLAQMRVRDDEIDFVWCDAGKHTVPKAHIATGKNICRSCAYPKVDPGSIAEANAAALIAQVEERRKRKAQRSMFRPSTHASRTAPND